MPATTRLAVRQVSGRHRITVIRAADRARPGYGREPATAARMRRPHVATPARWPQYRAPGQRAKDIATDSTRTLSTSRRRPRSRNKATKYAAARRQAATGNAPGEAGVI